jgi:transposase
MRKIQLNPSEEQTIRELVNNHANSHIRNRGQSILLSHLGLNVKKIAQTFSVRTRTIYTWFDNYESNGFLGLMTAKGQGRKTLLSKLNQEQTKQITDWVDEGKSLKSIPELIDKNFGLSVSKFMIKSMIKKKDIDGNVSENG